MRLSCKSLEVVMTLCAGLAVMAGVTAFFSFLEYLYAALHPVLAPIRFGLLEQLCLGSVFVMVFMIWLYGKIAPSRYAWKSEAMLAESEAEGQAGGLCTAKGLWVHESLCWVFAGVVLTWLGYIWSRGLPYEWPSPVGVFLLLCLPVLAGFLIWRVFKLEEQQRGRAVQPRSEHQPFDTAEPSKEVERGYEVALDP